MPKNPSSPIRRSTSRGTQPCSSHALANGLTSVSTKRRTWRRNSSCSSRKYGEGRDSGADVTVRFMGSAESFPGERGAATERRQFGERGLAVHGRHAAVGAGKNPFGGHVANRLLDRRDDLLGRLDLIATCWIWLAASAGKIASYWRHSPPSDAFHSRFAAMP